MVNAPPGSCIAIGFSCWKSHFGRFAFKGDAFIFARNDDAAAIFAAFLLIPAQIERNFETRRKMQACVGFD